MSLNKISYHEEDEEDDDDEDDDENKMAITLRMGRLANQS